MRSSFGRYAQKLRADRGMSQKEFAEAAGIALSRVSNLEYQRTAISDDVIGGYIKTLSLNGEEAHQLRTRANFSDSVRKKTANNEAQPTLQAMIELYGDKISPSGLAKIQRVIEDELQEDLAALRFSSNQTPVARTRSAKRAKRPGLLAGRFADLCLRAAQVRIRFAGNTEALKLGRVLEALAASDERFDYRVELALPSVAEGAFACILGDRNGHTLLLEEERYLAAERGQQFARHVICHELAHHFLHGKLLASKSELCFPPQQLAMNSISMLGTSQQIEQVVDSVVEAEAECFATLFLVPWEAFMKGTHAKYLASDFGEQQGEVERYFGYFSQDSVIDALRSKLWERGDRDHPIFA
ncbi:helix-turn-helix domain-containing protein [Ruegeria jejuensis]|uniref:helix-turn-helix domain-containing protein n=1 Tax=Ruegeria jejuensis TaxID=3233338 RepID=UPI00355C3719